MLNKHQQLFALNIALLIQYANSLEIGLTFGDAFRSVEEQKRLKQTGATQLMSSNHQRRLAVDFNFFIKGYLTYEFEDLKELGNYWERLHPANRWGGDWNGDDIPNGFLDTSHFEMNIK
jgi:hypothetical protein